MSPHKILATLRACGYRVRRSAGGVELRTGEARLWFPDWTSAFEAGIALFAQEVR